MPTAKYYCFTINNHTVEELANMRLVVPRDARYVCWQQEVGAAGTPHIQGYVEYKVKRSVAWMKLNGFPNRTHFEPRRGTRDEARDYTKKPDTAVPDTWEEHGTWIGGGGGGSELQELVSLIKDKKTDKQIIEDKPELYVRHFRAVAAVRHALCEHRSPDNPPVVRVFWGATGTGKTREAVSFARERELSYFLHHGTKWWDGYSQQSVVIVDEVDGVKWGSLGITYFLGLLDRYEFTVEVKGGSVPFNSPYIFLTSNVEPRHWFPSASGEQVDALYRRFSEVRQFVGGGGADVVVVDD